MRRPASSPTERCSRRRGSGGAAAAAIAAMALAAAGLPVTGCGGDRPSLPAPAAPPADTVAVTPPEVAGQSEEFKNMEVPPEQHTRALPIGEAWAPDDGPLYRSLCLQCHSVSQTTFAVTDWRESLHARAGVTCSACHGTHEGAFVPQPGPDRCSTCHVLQVEEFLASAHGSERAPGMRCISCHEAHATDRGFARSITVCLGCHLDSDHVQGFPSSRMGLVLAEHPPAADGARRAADCVTCHMPDSPVLLETGDFRNDRVTLHDPAVTVARHPKDDTLLAPETIEFLVPVCVECHSERNARHRLENSDPLIRHWTPVGMSAETRRRPVPAVPGEDTR